MTGDDITTRTAEIGLLFEERLGLRGGSLDRQVRRAGRGLPRAIAREARYLAQAESLAANPRLWRQVDPVRLQAAHRIVCDHLRGIDPRERRKTRIIGVASSAAFNLLAVTALVLVVLVWRGYA